MGDSKDELFSLLDQDPRDHDGKVSRKEALASPSQQVVETWRLRALTRTRT